MRALLHSTLCFSIFLFSCYNIPSDFPEPEESILETQSLKSSCPIDCCQVVSIELSMPEYNYRAPFTCYKWTDWGTGLEVNWADGGRILFFTFPNHRICNPVFKICAEDICNCEWQPIKDCPRNNTLTVPLDSCLYGQTTLFLDVHLVDD